MNQNPRLSLMDTGRMAIMKMAEGNPGAMNVCVSLLQQGQAIDPKGAMGGMMNILDLDDLEIYGSDIWDFGQYVCDGRTDNVVLVLRSRQLGFISGDSIKNAISARKSDFDFADLASKVRAEIGEFNWPYDQE